MAREARGWGTPLTGNCGYSAVGLVVGATKPEQASRLRQLVPHAFFLVPGLGAQGARPEDLKPFFNSDGLGALVTVSRSLIYANEAHPGTTLEDAVGKEAEALARQVRTVLGRAA